MSQAEAEFLGWVARERAALEQAERPTVGDVVAWLEKEKAKAENLIFSYSLRNEPLKAAYEEGRLEVINAVLRKLRRIGQPGGVGASMPDFGSGDRGSAPRRATTSKGVV